MVTARRDPVLALGLDYCRLTRGNLAASYHSSDLPSSERDRMVQAGPIDLLIVDDDAEFLGTLVRRFRRRGYRAKSAGDGAEALGLAERKQFDVAILDMVMPGLSGLELLEKLKAANPGCEVIMLTGQGTIETAVAGRNSHLCAAMATPRAGRRIARRPPTYGS